jgi:hypothetical protein
MELPPLARQRLHYKLADSPEVSLLRVELQLTTGALQSPQALAVRLVKLHGRPSCMT